MKYLYKISLNNQKQIMESLKFSLINNEMKQILEEFFLQKMFKKEFENNSGFTYYKCGLLNLINGTEKHLHSIADINWENYCILMQEFKKINLVTSQSYNDHVKSFSRKSLLEFYFFVIEKYLNENEQLQWKSYIDLLIEIDVAFYKNFATDDFLNTHLRTNFPLNSSPEKMVAVKLNNLKANLFINCYNDFLFKVLKDFLFEGNVYKNRLAIRLFFYYFEESLGEGTSEVVNVNFFDSSTFKTQYLFFKEIEDRFNKVPANSPVNTLVKFYLYIDQKFYKDKGVRLFSTGTFNKELLTQSRYFTFITNGYELMYKNAYEPFPSNDKWVLLYDENTKSSQIAKNNCMLDFTLIEDETLKKDLKMFIWQQNISNQALRDYFRVISKFLITYCKYRIENVIYLKNSMGMSNDFLLKYRTVLQMRNTMYNKMVNNRTVDNELNILSKYLKHYKDKYKVNDVSFEIFKANNTIKFSGGNPIESEEFEAISNEFRVNAIDEETELFFIIFQLTSSTKLRVGEVINLERDCIKNASDALGYGEIEYISKTSNGEYMREVLLLEDINLIKRALELTKNIVPDAPLKYQKYIFLIKHGRKKNMVIKLRNQYKEYFNRITCSLKKRGLINNDYVPYNARHTFIDNAWGALEDGLITEVEVLAITGNSAKVASRHYRKYKTKKYVEATYMVSIGDVQLDGTIFKDEQEIHHLPQVQRGAGACNSKECVKDDLQDTDYKCLICKKFVTSIQRLGFFENKLEEIQVLKSNAKSDAIIEYYKAQEKLYGAYLAEILALSEDLTDDSIDRR